MELFSICDGLPSTASRIDQLLSYGVDLDISDDVCSLISFIICILWVTKHLIGLWVKVSPYQK